MRVMDKTTILVGEMQLPESMVLVVAAALLRRGKIPVKAVRAL